MECSDPSFFFLFDNINVSSFTELHEYPLPTSDFQLRPTDLYSGLSSPNSQFPPSPSYHSPIQQQQNNAISCFPSPTNTIIEADKTSPLLQPYTVRSHSIEHHYHPIHPVLVPLHQKENTHQSILTTIDNNKKKSHGKKQKRMNELPYAPNLLNLQLTPPPKHIPTSLSHQKRVGSKIKSAGTMISTAPTKSTNNYRCDYPNCDKTFTRPYNLKSHRRTHTAERPFDCPLCSKSFARQHDRNRHAKLHLGIKPYTCQFCNKSFARQDALNRHQRMDTSSIPTCSRSIGGRRKRKPTPSSLLFCPS